MPISPSVTIIDPAIVSASNNSTRSNAAASDVSGSMAASNVSGSNVSAGVDAAIATMHTAHMGATEAATTAVEAATTAAAPSGVCLIKRSPEEEGQCSTEQKNLL